MSILIKAFSILLIWSDVSLKKTSFLSAVKKLLDIIRLLLIRVIWWISATDDLLVGAITRPRSTSLSRKGLSLRDESGMHTTVSRLGLLSFSNTIAKCLPISSLPVLIEPKSAQTIAPLLKTFVITDYRPSSPIFFQYILYRVLLSA